MKPLISIIVPCYNVETYLHRCIDSLVHQTLGLEQLEIILVNDASTDSTYARLCEWEKRYPDNILVINCTENGRQGTARNLGIHYASGTYLAFVDADDWVEPDMYEFMTQKAIAHDADMVICNMDKRTSDGTSIPCTRWKNEFIDIQTPEDKSSFLLNALHYTTCVNFIYNRDWFTANDLFFPEKLLYEDHIMFLVYASANRIYASDKIFYHYFINTAGTVGTNKNPFDRLLVHAQLYPRLCEKQFSSIKNISDFNYFDKCFAETAFYGVAPTGDQKLLQYIKDILFQTVPDICNNPYYCRDIPLPNITVELLLHPLVEQDVTADAFKLFLRRYRYCLNFPGSLVYCDMLIRLHRKLELQQHQKNFTSGLLPEVIDELLKICKRYCLEPFAHTDAAELFLKSITKICDSNDFEVEELMDLIYDFSVTITI